MRMRYRVLGPLEVWDGSAWTRLSAAKPRTLLAFLLVHAGRLVSADSLIAELWGDDVPPSAAKSLRVYVHRLRRSLGTSSNDLHSRPGGYELSTAPDDVDSHRFVRLADAGRAALADQRAQAAAETLTEALALWRGRPLADVPATPAVLAEAHRLAECRFAAWEDLARAKLAAGRHTELVADLPPLLAEQPLREPLYAMLMTALHRSGRRSDALHVYATAQRALTDELGVEPGSDLRRLHRLILADPDDTTLAGAAPPDVLAIRPPRAAPCHLPTAVPDFTGRRNQLDRVLGVLVPQDVPDRLADHASPAPSVQLTAPTPLTAPDPPGEPAAATPVPGRARRTPAPRTIAVTGKAGVGKSAFTVHVAHLLRPAFPDGQLYADLRTVGGRPAEPAEVLASLLRELGLAGAAIPDGVDERARRYRAELAHRRMLVVLDNAASEHQVRPLLPGAGASAVLVSSRRTLAGIEGALRVGLDVLPDDEALELLARAAGDDRTRREPTAAHRIVRLCGNLPLAVRIVGARLATRSHLSASRLADALVDERHRLDELVAGDLEVRASVSLGYEALDAAAQRAFRLLAAVDAPTVPSWAAGALLDLPGAEADRVVDTLVDNQLVEIDSVDTTGEPRLRLHDLLRLYGRERADAQEPAGERGAALVRVCAAYLALVQRVNGELDAGFLGPLPVPTPAPTWRLQAALADRLLAAPLAWLDAERTTLCALVRQAAQCGAPGIAWRLAASLASYFEIGAHFDDWRHTHQVALTAAHRAGEELGEALLHRNLGELGTVQDRYGEAGASFELALKKCTEHGQQPADRDTPGTRPRGTAACAAPRGAGPRDAAAWLEAATGIGLGVLLRLRGRYAEAAASLQRGVAQAREIGNTRAEVYARSALASVHLERGEPVAARGELRHALDAGRDDPHPGSEYAVQRSLGLAELAAGRLPQAAGHMENAWRAAVAQGDRSGPVHARLWLAHLADVSGDAERAERMLDECLADYRRFGEWFGEALSLRMQADLQLHAGRCDLAMTAVRSSLSVWRRLDTPYWTSRTLDLLAQVQAASGHLGTAAAARTRAEARSLRASLGLPGTLRPATVGGRSLGGHLTLPANSPARQLPHAM